ncbi:MAG: hypothetical protein ABW063_03260 [Caulobacter sp.]
MIDRNAHFNFLLAALAGGWSWQVFDARGAQLASGFDHDRRVAAARIIKALIVAEVGGEPLSRLRAA